MKISNINTCTRRERNKFCFKSRFVHYIQISHTRIYSHRFYTTLLCDLTHDYQHFKYKHEKKKKLFNNRSAIILSTRSKWPTHAVTCVGSNICEHTNNIRHSGGETKKENMCVCACFCGFLLLKMVILYQQKAHIYSPTKSATTHSFLELASINAVRARASQAQLFFFQTTVPEG